MKRREFLKLAGATAAGLAAGKLPAEQDNPPRGRPNVVWITCEDMGPHLGCFGDDYAVSPNLDRLAKRSVRYTRAFAMAPVCAPSRSCLITGMYPSSIGSHHMRSAAVLPKTVKCFTEHLRGAGYYCSNRQKEDYNFRTPRTAWDESSREAHWRKRAEGQPFFSVFNLTITHESRIRSDPKSAPSVRDPVETPVPPFHPQTPIVRRDWANYYDLIPAMDKQAGQILGELEADGLAEDTIVFFFSDHGTGLPRCKRWLYESGLHVPLIVHVPEKLAPLAPAKAGTATDRLVSFVDFAPTVLSLAGVEIPAHMQGKAFLGAEAQAPREYIVGIRDRMDERRDFLRCARDGKYKYIRNFLPHLPYSQHLEYQELMPTMQEFRRLRAEGKLEGPAALFMRERKPVEELYDLDSDPHELNNLVGSDEHRQVLERMRKALREWMLRTRDLGPLPEAQMHERCAGGPAYDMARRPGAYDVERTLEAAELAGRGKEAVLDLLQLLSDEDDSIRFWAVTGLCAAGSGTQEILTAFNKALKDPSTTVRVAAADALRRTGAVDEVLPTLTKALRDENEWVRLRAVTALDEMGQKARPVLAEIRRARKDSNQYVQRVVRHAMKTFEG